MLMIPHNFPIYHRTRSSWFPQAVPVLFRYNPPAGGIRHLPFVL